MKNEAIVIPFPPLLELPHWRLCRDHCPRGTVTLVLLTLTGKSATGSWCLARVWALMEFPLKGWHGRENSVVGTGERVLLTSFTIQSALQCQENIFPH